MADAENVIDHYEMGNCISTGNTTAVWEARDVRNGQQCAMKLLLPEALKTAEAKGALKHEFNVANSVSHPNIIRVFECKVTRNHGYFTMEHIRASNLKTLIRNELPFAQARAKRMMECISQALAVMHEKGWVHRDLKPENILMTKGGEIRLIDFALASRPTGLLAKTLTRKKSVVIQGTRTYLAPELVQRQPLTFAADMYSLGIVLYEVLTGVPPFRNANPNELLMMHVRERVVPPSDINTNVSADADALIAKMLAKKPKDRPPSMQQLFSEVRNIKLFKEDPEAYAKTKAEADGDRFKKSMAARLDSRADALRQELIAKGELVPEPPKPKKKPKPALTTASDSKRSAQAPAPPAQGVPGYAGPQPMPVPAAYPYPPGYPAPYPGMPLPGMPMAPMPYPAPYPGAAYPPPFPGAPAGGPAVVPPGQTPAPPPQAPAAAAPRPAAPQAPVPQAPRPAAPSPAAPPAKPPSAADDIPLATSIDDIEIG